MNALFLGGDSRQEFAASLLNQNNIHAKAYTRFNLDNRITDQVKASNYIILPLPISKDGININMNTSDKEKTPIIDILNFMNTGSIFLGGKIDENTKKEITKREIRYVDYFDIESFQINNALLSAEGAIYYAKQRISKSIYGSKVAVLGFGRIGKILSYLLHSHGALITVCARKDEDYTWSRLIGFNGVKMKKTGDRNDLNLKCREYDIIFNTIPHWIMDEEFVSNLSPQTIIIDLASHPFGIDESLVKKYRLNYYHELAIPGRYAPQSAGELVGKTILNIIQGGL